MTSISLIKETIKGDSFHFNTINIDGISKQSSYLDPKKSCTFNDIPAKYIKVASNECSEYLARIWNEATIAQNSEISRYNTYI